MPRPSKPIAPHVPEDPQQWLEYAEGFWVQVDVRGPDDCWLWRGKLRNNQGYGSYRGVSAHRVSLYLTTGQDGHGPICVLHSCDEPGCCNPSHLRLGTHAENMRDRNTRRRTASGERSGAHKLNEAQVMAIRTRYAAGEKQVALAREFGVTQPTVCLLLQGKSWSHLPVFPRVRPR